MPVQSEKQLEYWANATHRWNIKVGATRSGKTYGDYFIIPRRILAVAGKPGLNIIMGNTKGTLMRNVIAPMQELYGYSMVSDIRGDNTATMFGQQCFCLGADNIKHVDKIRGAGFKYLYGDEFITWHPDVLTMVKSRMDKAYSLADLTGNPDSPHHPMKKFIDSNADIYYQTYCIDDNPFLDPSFVTNLKLEYEGTVYYDRYILGKWVAAEGAIYRAFADNSKEFIVDQSWLKTHRLLTSAIGVDFGGNASGHAFNCTGFETGFRSLITLEEWYHKGEITPTKLENEFVQFAKLCIDRYGTLEAYCDNAEPTLIQGLRSACIRERLPIDIRDARKGLINGRIRFWCRMMGARRFYILNHCKHTIDAFSNAVWDSKKLEDERLDNGTTNIDNLDASEYSAEPYMEAMTYAKGGIMV